MKIANLLAEGIEYGASDILLANGAPPIFRIAGELKTLSAQPLSAEELEILCRGMLSSDQQQTLDLQQDVDFSHTVADLGRFRVNVHRQRNSYAAAIRTIPSKIPSLDALNLPPIVDELTKARNGLVLVTGQTGSGKSTTLAAMINQINLRDHRHIITLEDPIEFLFPHRKSLVEQREIGSDCPNFASGLKHVLRQDPDVILVGELRDLETIRIALQAAETGHLVLSTLHSSTAAGAVDRIIEVFPASEQTQIRSHLAESLKAVLTQTLVPTAEKSTRAAAVEVMLNTRGISTSIREANTHLISGMISVNRRTGMQTMDQAIKELVLNGVVSSQVASSYFSELTSQTVS